jgi:hypothetical protein
MARRSHAEDYLRSYRGASVSDVYNDSAFDSDEFDSREEYAGEPGYWSSGPSKSSGYYYGPDDDEDEYDD